MTRRKRWTWTPWRPGLALELTDYRGLTCPWLSRMAGRPVARPDALRLAAPRLAELSVQIVAAFDGFAASVQQAADAIQAFGMALSGVKVTK